MGDLPEIMAQTSILEVLVIKIHCEFRHSNRDLILIHHLEFRLVLLIASLQQLETVIDQL